MACPCLYIPLLRMHISQLLTLLAYGLFSGVSLKSQVFKEDFLDYPAVSQPPLHLLPYFISNLIYYLSTPLVIRSVIFMIPCLYCLLLLPYCLGTVPGIKLMIK